MSASRAASTPRPVIRGLLILGALFLALAGARSQVDSLGLPADTLHAVPRFLASESAESLAVPRSRTESKPAWVAVGLSAALPGAGQIYTENYWKAPLIWGLGGYWIYEWAKQNDKYKDFRQRYSASITPETPQGSAQLLGLRDYYRDQRDSFAWYMGFLYFLNLVDAYVDAQLYDFDVSPELSADGHLQPRLRATLHVPLY